MDGTSEELDVYYVYLSYEEINRFRKDFDIVVKWSMSLYLFAGLP